ncbi:phosphoribosylaminoimidazolesuccinocarboxamide synthase [Streptomyces nogalater]
MDRPVIEYTTKLEEIDRFVGREEAAAIGGLDARQQAELEDRTRLVAEVVAGHARRVGLVLADGKVEYGRDARGRLILVDHAGTPTRPGCCWTAPTPTSRCCATTTRPADSSPAWRSGSGRAAPARRGPPPTPPARSGGPGGRDVPVAVRAVDRHPGVGRRGPGPGTGPAGGPRAHRPRTERGTGAAWT